MASGSWIAQDKALGRTNECVYRGNMPLRGYPPISVSLFLPQPTRHFSSGKLRTGNFFARARPLIKTVMRLFTAANNYSQLWLCSIDYDSHE